MIRHLRNNTLKRCQGPPLSSGEAAISPNSRSPSEATSASRKAASRPEVRRSGPPPPKCRFLWRSVSEMLPFGFRDNHKEHHNLPLPPHPHPILTHTCVHKFLRIGEGQYVRSVVRNPGQAPPEGFLSTCQAACFPKYSSATTFPSIRL